MFSFSEEKAALWAVGLGLYMALLIGQIEIWQETGWERRGDWNAAKGPRQGLEHRAAAVRTKPTELNGALYPSCLYSIVAYFLSNPWVVLKKSPSQLLWFKNDYLYLDLHTFLKFILILFFSILKCGFCEICGHLALKRGWRREHVFGPVWPALLFKAVGLMNYPGSQLSVMVRNKQNYSLKAASEQFEMDLLCTTHFICVQNGCEILILDRSGHCGPRVIIRKMYY